MPRFRIVFFGTPGFAVPSLRKLLDGPDEVVGVVCQPDRPAGRGQRLHAPPVKDLAMRRGAPVLQPQNLRSDEFLAQLSAWAPDIGVVAAYGRILPKAVLELPRLGCINVHASLLPAYRGAAPIQWAILQGETTTGITIMQLNERMDEGDILLQHETRIGAEETYGELQDRLAIIGAEVLEQALAGLHTHALSPRPQDHARATFAPMIRKEDGCIDWTRPAAEIARKVRAFNPWPSAYTLLGAKLLKIHKARAARTRSDGAPGTVLSTGDVLAISTGDGVLEVTELQLEGRRRMAAAELCRGGTVRRGQALGQRG